MRCSRVYLLAAALLLCTWAFAATPAEHVALLRAMDMLAQSNAHAAAVHAARLTSTNTLIDGLPAVCWRRLVQARCALINARFDDAHSNCMAVLPLLESSAAAPHCARQYDVLCMLKSVAKHRGADKRALQDLSTLSAAMQRLKERTHHMPALSAKVIFDCVQLDGIAEETQRLSALHNNACQELYRAAPTNFADVARVLDAVCAWLACRQDIARQRITQLEPVEHLMPDILPAHYHALVEWLLHAGDYTRAYAAITKGTQMVPAEDAAALGGTFIAWVEHADSGVCARAVSALVDVSARRPYSQAWAPHVARVRAMPVQPRLLFYERLRQATARHDNAALLSIYAAQQNTDGSWLFLSDAITWLIHNNYAQHVPPLLMFSAAPDQRAKYPDIKACWRTMADAARGQPEREQSVAVTWFTTCRNLLVPHMENKSP